MMATDSSLYTKVAVSFLPKLNTMARLPLLGRCGGIEGFFRESKKGITAICREFNCLPEMFDRQSALNKAKTEINAIDKHDIRICSVEDYNYPCLLKQCEDTPLILYYKGTLETEHIPHLAIVGTRNASEYYKNRVQDILRELADMKHRLVIVSGLAYGIDITAHSASLQQQFRTYAVLGHGLHTIYPAAHRKTSEKIIAAQGALISEFPTTTPFVPANFLQRNRIIAGLCHATLVAESALKGGAMATARMAVSYNRDVLAIPGKPTDPFSRGCNLLIKENMAALTENGEDIANALGLKCIPPGPVQTSLDIFGVNDREAFVKKLLQTKGCLNIEEISKFLSIPTSELNVILLKLEFEGYILALPGKNYTIN